MIGAIQTAGWRSKTLWAFAVVFGALSCAYGLGSAYRDVDIAGRVLWALMPLVAISLGLLAVSGREPKKSVPRPPGANIAENPALTPQYLNELVANVTQLDARRRIENLGRQRARVRGQVLEIVERWDHIEVQVVGLVTKFTDWWNNGAPQGFRKDQAAALQVVRPKDWIEFVGTVAHDGFWGWTLTRCEFVAKVDPPEPPKPKTSRSRKASTAGSPSPPSPASL